MHNLFCFSAHSVDYENVIFLSFQRKFMFPELIGTDKKTQNQSGNQVFWFLPDEYSSQQINSHPLQNKIKAEFPGSRV